MRLEVWYRQVCNFWETTRDTMEEEFDVFLRQGPQQHCYAQFYREIRAKMDKFQTAAVVIDEVRCLRRFLFGLATDHNYEQISHWAANLILEERC